MMLNHHPAPGLGDLLPGFFVVPQNPIKDATTYVPRIGEILPASYAVPQNPIKDYMSGRLNLIGREPGVPGMVNGKGVSGCGCGGSCGGCGGLGDISSDMAKISSDFTAGNYGQILQDSIVGIPVWAICAGLLALMFVGGEKHSYAGRGRRAYRAAAGAF
jgi:hypothetical protein